MSYEDSVKEGVSLVFEEVGKTVTFKKKSSPISNSWGEETGATYTDSTVSMLPLNVLVKDNFYSPFGDLMTGEQDVYFQSSVSVSIGDQVVYDGDTYEVREVDSYRFPSVVLIVARITKNIDA